jgi:hypothetical protein
MLFRKILPSLILFFVSYMTQAQTLTGEGYGVNPEAARNEALATLANSIFVQVESSTKSYRDSKGIDLFSTAAHTSSNLPLFGLSFDCRPKGEQNFCRVYMDVAKALPLYRQKIKGVRVDINARLERIEKLPKSQHYVLLEKTSVDYAQFSKYRTVMLYLSGYEEVIDSPSISQLMVQERLAALESRVTTLDLAAILLAREINVDSLYISPPALQNSREITPFSTAMWQALKQQLKSTGDQTSANYHYRGQYQVHAQGLRLSYNLIDHDGNTVKAKVVELTPDSYQRFRTTALAPDFDTLLHKGYAVASDFKIQLSTNKGSSQLLFKKGETAQLLVKLNKAGYFYMVGHSKNNETEISYLLDVNEANRNRRFISYINADDVNKWVSIGEFDISPPFGVESLQLIASENDLVNKLPEYTFDNVSGYYVVARNIEKGVDLTRKTRGLKKKKNTLIAETAETVLLFTTQE